MQDPAQDTGKANDLWSFGFDSAHLEFMGLMVMAWKTLKRQVVLMEAPLATLCS